MMQKALRREDFNQNVRIPPISFLSTTGRVS